MELGLEGRAEFIRWRKWGKAFLAEAWAGTMDLRCRKACVLGHGETFSGVGIDFEGEVMRKSRLMSVKACFTLREQS